MSFVPCSISLAATFKHFIGFAAKLLGDCLVRHASIMPQVGMLMRTTASQTERQGQMTDCQKRVAPYRLPCSNSVWSKLDSKPEM
jgi:hypothetical protein